MLLNLEGFSFARLMFLDVPGGIGLERLKNANAGSIYYDLNRKHLTHDPILVPTRDAGIERVMADPNTAFYTSKTKTTVMLPRGIIRVYNF